jgi:hypothetical protein
MRMKYSTAEYERMFAELRERPPRPDERLDQLVYRLSYAVSRNVYVRGRTHRPARVVVENLLRSLGHEIPWSKPAGGNDAHS